MIIYTAENKERKCIYIGKTDKGLDTRKYYHYYSCFKDKDRNKFYNFIRKYGWDSFEWKIRSPYASDIKGQEEFWIKYYRNHYDGEVLNMTDGGDGGDTWKYLSHEKVTCAIKTISEKMSGDKNPMYGKRLCGESNGHKRKILLISPEGKEYKFNGTCNQFCKNNGLDFSTIVKVLRGIHQKHKGWTGRYL